MGRSRVGGPTNGSKRGQVTFYPYTRGRERFSHVKGGGDTAKFEVVFTWVLEVLAILKRGCKKC